MFTREWTGQRAQTCRSVPHRACGAPPPNPAVIVPPRLDRAPTHAHMMAICNFYIQRCDKQACVPLPPPLASGLFRRHFGAPPTQKKKILPKKNLHVKMHYGHQNISVYTTTVASIKSDKLFKHPPPPPPPPTTSTTTPGEFLIKPPICFKLAPLTVHLCKIPGIMKDLSNGNPFGLIWLLIGERVAPQLSVQQVALRRVRTPDSSVG